jgi:hypothetical protein
MLAKLCPVSVICVPSLVHVQFVALAGFCHAVVIVFDCEPVTVPAVPAVAT